jgi:hypothetical protein
MDQLRNEILERISTLKLQIEKGLIITETYKKPEVEPMIIKTAKALYELLDDIPIVIEDWQLIVGTPSAEPFTLSPHPEASGKDRNHCTPMVRDGIHMKYLKRMHERFIHDGSAVRVGNLASDLFRLRNGSR